MEFISFEFLKEPIIVDRTPSANMPKEMLKDIKALPYIIWHFVEFKIVLKINEKEIVLNGIIPKGFKYNQADIPWLVQPISMDNNSPMIKNASLIHDYLLDYRYDLFNVWNFSNLGLTISDFRKITTECFKSELIKAGTSKSKAKIMSGAVHFFQCLMPSWWKNKF